MLDNFSLTITRQSGHSYQMKKPEKASLLVTAFFSKHLVVKDAAKDFVEQLFDDILTSLS